MRLRLKFTIYILGGMLIPLFLAFGALFYKGTQHLQDRTLELAGLRLNSCASQLSAFLTARISEIETYASMPIIRQMDFSVMDSFLRQERQNRSHIYEKFIVGTPEGHFYNTAGGNPYMGGLRTFDDTRAGARLKSISKRDYWVKTVPENRRGERLTYISDPMISYTTEAKQVVISSSIIAEEGKVAGMIGGAIQWEIIRGEIKKIEAKIRQEHPWDPRIILISSNGIYWHHWDTKKIVHLAVDEAGEPVYNETGEKDAIRYNILDETDTGLSEIGREMVAGGSGLRRVRIDSEETSSFVFYAPIPASRYSIAMLISENKLHAPVRRQKLSFLLLILLTLTLAVGVSFLMSRRIANPIIHLNNMAGAITKGEWKGWISVTGHDEVANLTRAFNEMSEAIDARESALKESEEKYRSVVENANEAITVIQDGKFKYFNPKTIELIGYSEVEMTDKPFLEVVHPDDREMIMDKYIKRLRGEEIDEIYTFRAVSKQGNIIWAEIKPVVVKWAGSDATLCFLTDITSKKRSEELMIQSEKMMSLGNLAAGMAHEVNNPLSAMLQGIQMIRRRLSPENKHNSAAADKFGVDLKSMMDYLDHRQINHYFDEVQDAGKRAGNIVANMLRFSRKSVSEKQPEDVAGLIRNSVKLANKSYDLKKRFDFRKINVKREIEEDLPTLLCSHSEIEQVLLNLFKNSAQAMAEQPGYQLPCIIVRAKRVGDYLRIEVEDNGPGMDEAERKRIFEPFFTTKSPGDGTGLGLSVTYQIVTVNHQGTIEVESERGQGTKFIIQLPLEGD